MGSLYLYSGALLSLALPADDPFWTGEAVPWASQKVWGGEICRRTTQSDPYGKKVAAAGNALYGPAS